MKLLKWLGIGIVSIVALLALAIGIISATFDPNAYKDDITRYVQQNQQRTLTIPGKLSLSFFPKVGVQVGALSLSEFNSDKVFARLAGARVSVALLPLLSKQVVVDRVQIDALSASIVKGRNGKFNFDDLINPQATPAGKPADTPETKAQAFKVDIDSVKIDDASVSYKDESNGTQIAVSQLNLQTGRIADKMPTTLELSAKLDGVKPKAALSLGLRGGMTMDLGAGKFAFTGLAVSLAGDMQDGATTLSGLNLALDANGLQLDTGALLVAASNLTLTAKGRSAGNAFDVKAELASLDLDGTTHRIAVEGLAADGSGAAEGLELSRLSAKAPKLMIDMAGGQIDVDRVALSASGKRQGDPFELSLNAPRLRLSQSTSSGEAITGAVKIAGRQKLDARFNLSGVSGNTKSFAISSITLDYDAANADSSAVGTLSTALTGNLDARIFELKKIDANVKVVNPYIPAKTVTLPIQGSVRADLGKGRVTADIRTRFDESVIQAKVGMPTLTPPSYDFDVRIDKLNADRYRTGAPAATAGAPTVAATAPAGAETPIDLSALKGLRAHGSVRIGALQASNVKLSNVEFTLDAAGGKVQIAPLKASLYGGSMRATAGIDANSNGYSFTNTLSSVQVGPLMKDAANQDILEGRGNVVVDVTTSGTSPSALKRALAGNVNIKLNDGAIKGINIGERIRKAKSLLGAKTGAEAANKNEKTDFSELSLSATISNGVATSNDLKMASPLLRAKGAGQVDIGANTLDYTIHPKLVATAKGQEGKSYEQLSGIEMPVRIYGALDAPQYKPDYAAAAMSAAKSEIGSKLLEKASGGKAGGLLGAILGKEEARPAPAGAAPTQVPADDKQKKARELLKGLFN